MHRTVKLSNVHVRRWDGFDLGSDTVLRCMTVSKLNNISSGEKPTTEVQHLLRLLDATDAGTRKAAAASNDAERVQAHRVLGNADLDDAAVAAEQGHVLVKVQVCGHGVDDEVEVALQGREGLRIRRRVVLVRAELEAELLLAERLREDCDLGAECPADRSASKCVNARGSRRTWRS